MRHPIGALGVLLVILTFAPAAIARVDVVQTPSPALKLDWPAQGTLTDEFGPRWGRLHAGIDIGILQSLRLEAATGGVVRKTGYIRGYEGYGNVVVLDAGNGYRLLYAHLSRVYAKPGQLVERGDLLGLAGCTGSCTGTHLHLEVHKNGRALDPLRFMRRYNAR